MFNIFSFRPYYLIVICRFCAQVNAANADAGGKTATAMLLISIWSAVRRPESNANITPYPTVPPQTLIQSRTNSPLLPHLVPITTPTDSAPSAFSPQSSHLLATVCRACHYPCRRTPIVSLFGSRRRGGLGHWGCRRRRRRPLRV